MKNRGGKHTVRPCLERVGQVRQLSRTAGGYER